MTWAGTLWGGDVTGLTWVPLVPWPLLVALGVVALVLVALGLMRRARGALLRAVPLAALLLVLAGPQVVREARSPLPDVAVVVIDDSTSQDLGDRRALSEAAAEVLGARLGEDETLDLRVVRAGTRPGRDGTHLFAALEDAVADVPRRRLAGAVLLTDGQVHDVPDDPAAAFAAPVHVLLTGRRGESDRRVVVESAPAYGLVGRTVSLRVSVHDPAVPDGTPIPLTVTVGEDAPAALTAQTGRTLTLPLPIRAVGPNVIEVAAEARPDELTALNNRIALTVNGVRDRLRVLLISGEPHVGERAWRNLLKADPNVDLVHFTILRPPTKDDGTPLNELALIAFPIRELFEERLAEFDLVIFDRYSRRGLVPFGFLRNIADYVGNGGAMLQSVGPEYASPFSLYDSPLAEILPAAPLGTVTARRFTPQLSEPGRRHPVTADLDGAGSPDQPPTWGDWLRVVPTELTRGVSLMDGADGAPLLVLDRVGEGRVAVLLSDTAWLWQRGWDGGGPQTEMIRRVAHWLMGEPDLEEDALRARVEAGTLMVERRLLAPETAADEITVTPPDGDDERIPLAEAAPGLHTARTDAALPGLYRVSDGTRTAVAAAGLADPLEMSDVATTDEHLAPMAEATGGRVFWLGERGGAIPTVRRTAPEALHGGNDWIGLRANGDHTVHGVRQAALLPPALALPLVLLGLLAAWWREGR